MRLRNWSRNAAHNFVKNAKCISLACKRDMGDDNYDDYMHEEEGEKG
jgi:hypothetical protein